MEETLNLVSNQNVRWWKETIMHLQSLPRLPEPTWRISAVMKTFKGVLTTEEGCIQENNYLACNSLEEVEYFREESCWEVKKMQPAKGWLFAAEFKIINAGAEKREKKVKLFYLSKYYKVGTII